MIPGAAGPGGLPSMGLHRVGHNWSDLAAAAVAEQIWLMKFGLHIILLLTENSSLCGPIADMLFRKLKEVTRH